MRLRFHVFTALILCPALPHKLGQHSPTPLATSVTLCRHMKTNRPRCMGASSDRCGAPAHAEVNLSLASPVQQFESPSLTDFESPLPDSFLPSDLLTASAVPRRCATIALARAATRCEGNTRGQRQHALTEVGMFLFLLFCFLRFLLTFHLQLPLFKQNPSLTINCRSWQMVRFRMCTSRHS